MISAQENKKNNFSIKTSDFEGPFDTLYFLIEKKKISINDVSLASITDEYIKFVSENEFHLKDTASFIQTAATLMLIKSKSLIPKFVLSDEEKDDVEELKERLKIYKEFVLISSKIKKIIFNKVSYKKIYRKNIEIKFRPDSSINLENIKKSLHEVFAQAPESKFVAEKKVTKTKSLKEVIDLISKRVKMFARASFADLIVGGTKKDISVSFLAVLELFRQGSVDVKQENDFCDIIIETKDSISENDNNY